jgi:hypothetical protein
MSKPIEDRFWDKVKKTDGCWIWTGARWGSVYKRPGEYRYGAFRVGSSMVAVHRISYEMANGAIPSGLTIDHLCFNKLCVKPEHLEAVSSAENTRRAWARRREMASK